MQKYVIMAIFVLLICSPLTGMTSNNTPGNYPLTIINLENRNAADIVSILQPHLGNDTSISHTNYQIIINAPPKRVKQIQALIKELDKPIEILEITAEYFSNQYLKKKKLKVCAQLREKGMNFNFACSKHTPHVSLAAATKRKNDYNRQNLRVNNGGIAYIYSGKEIPIVNFSHHAHHHEHGDVGIEYKPVLTGFYIKPFVSGSRVRLELSANRNTLSKEDGGNILRNEWATTIVVPMDTWVNIGGSQFDESQSGGEILYSTTSKRESDNSLWIRVRRISSDPFEN